MLNKGRYELLEEIGKGVFGHVFKAVERSNGQMVTVKIYKAYCGGTNFAAHAQEEINILRHLEPADVSANAFGMLYAPYVSSVT